MSMFCCFDNDDIDELNNDHNMFFHREEYDEDTDSQSMFMSKDD